MSSEERLGAHSLGDGSTRFVIWAPERSPVTIELLDPKRRRVELERCEDGYHRGTIEGVPPGTRYWVCIDERRYPDPASRHQPEGVHGPSEVVDLRHPFEAPNPAGTLERWVIYELHVGTFTEEGTLDAAIPELDRLAELGISAIELMPLAPFPGERNWGYDGVHPFAVHQAYGGRDALSRFVDACHRLELAVILDVVYNHLGPEGNYLSAFGPYFTEVYNTPWGTALNFDGEGSDEVRRYFIEHALSFLEDQRVDALRLDAVHAIFDRSAKPFLEELTEAVHRRASKVGRRMAVIAESDRNDPRTIRAREAGGLGLDGMWCDDLHHALHALLTGERSGYYADYGAVEDLARAYARGATYTGQRSRFRGRRHGRPFGGVAPEQLIVCAQNHDQVGNRMRGERLSSLCSFEAQKLAASVVLLSPFTPLLFMGEEYGEVAPFQYFVSHGDRALISAVREGREREFAHFGWKESPPDPQAEATYLRSHLDHGLRGQASHAAIEECYRRLIDVRARLPWKGELPRTVPNERSRTLFVEGLGPDRGWALFHFGESRENTRVPARPGTYRLAFHSADGDLAGPGHEAPEPLVSDGEVALPLEPSCALLYLSE